MKSVEICENEKCRYNNNKSCSLDTIMEKFKVTGSQCPSCAANNENIKNIILKELEDSGSCPRFM